MAQYFGTILVPGVSADFKILSQSLRLAQNAQSIRLSGDIVVFDSTGSHSDHSDEGPSLSLDGAETHVGLLSLSFKPIDDSTFEIISKLNISDRNIGEVSRFSFSSPFSIDSSRRLPKLAPFVAQTEPLRNADWSHWRITPIADTGPSHGRA
jgi:hypothetical protein